MTGLTLFVYRGGPALPLLVQPGLVDIVHRIYITFWKFVLALFLGAVCEQNLALWLVCGRTFEGASTLGRGALEMKKEGSGIPAGRSEGEGGEDNGALVRHPSRGYEFGVEGRNLSSLEIQT